MHQIYIIFVQVLTVFKVNPDPDPHFGFLCEHGARNLPNPILDNNTLFYKKISQDACTRLPSSLLSPRPGKFNGTKGWLV